MFTFLSNKYNNPLDTQNYRLSVPHEINVVSHSPKLMNDNVKFSQDR